MLSKTLIEIERFANACRQTGKRLRDLGGLDPAPEEEEDRDELRHYLAEMHEELEATVDTAKAMVNRVDGMLAAEPSPEIEEHRDAIVQLLESSDTDEEDEHERDEEEEEEEDEEEEEEDEEEEDFSEDISHLVECGIELPAVADHLEFIATFCRNREAARGKGNQYIGSVISGSNIGGVNVGNNGRADGRVTVSQPAPRPRRRS